MRILVSYTKKGGRDHKGFYFLGFQNGTLLYLDPHYVQVKR